MFWLFKPDDYFDIDWRRQAGAGPVFLNLIHDVDSLRYLFGEVVAVQARESSAVRGNVVEETSVILMEFASGLLATASVSDAVVAPWSWEMTAGEKPSLPENERGMLPDRRDARVPDDPVARCVEERHKTQLVGAVRKAPRRRLRRRPTGATDSAVLQGDP